MDLLPMARALDRLSGAPTMEHWVRFTAGRDFARRAPLVERYQQVRGGKLSEAELAAALKALLASKETDLILKVMLDSGAVLEDPKRYDALAASAGDPFYALQAEQQRATMEIHGQGQYQNGELRLKRAIAACREAHLDATCANLESDLSDLYQHLERLSEAWELGRSYTREARALNEFFLERYGIEAAAALARFRYAGSMSTALFYEALAMTPDDCGVQQDVHAQLTNMYLVDHHFEAARGELLQTRACPGAPLQLIAAMNAATLFRVLHHPEDLVSARAILTTARTASLSPPELAMADYVEGMVEFSSDPPAAQKAFRAAIARCDALPSWDIDQRKLRSFAYLELILQAAGRGEFEQALALFAEEQGAGPGAARGAEPVTPSGVQGPASNVGPGAGTPVGTGPGPLDSAQGTASLGVNGVPPPCTLAVAADDERVLAIAVTPAGKVVGALDAARATALTDAAEAVTPAVLAALQGCAQISVLARAPLHGQARLLPPGLAWSYRVPPRAQRGAAPSPTLPARRLVVANVTPPDTLNLPKLGPWRAQAVPGEHLVELAGAAATPARVLAELSQATEVEIHAHGLIDLSYSEASLIVLSAEPSGRFALTAGDLRGVRLQGAPTVLLAACDTAHAAPQEEEPWSLPVAFVEAGARAVWGTRADVPDSEAAAFFSALGTRVRAGEAPATALRDERLLWLAKAPESWVQNVVLFE
jgi:hypothetical protein